MLKWYKAFDKLSIEDQDWIKEFTNLEDAYDSVCVGGIFALLRILNQDIEALVRRFVGKHDEKMLLWHRTFIFEDALKEKQYGYCLEFANYGEFYNGQVTKGVSRADKAFKEWFSFERLIDLLEEYESGN